MNVGDMVTVVTLSGEYVGELTVIDDVKVGLKNPRMIVQSQQGMGFARGIAVTGAENPTDVEFRSVVFITEPNEDIVNAWKEATGAIVTPTTSIIT